jgi:hypothetical protein
MERTDGEAYYDTSNPSTGAQSPVRNNYIMQRSEFNGARDLFGDFIFNRSINLHE